MIPWITQRKVNLNIDLQDMACMRKRSRKKTTVKGMQEQNEESQGTAKASVGVGKKE